MQNRKPYGDLRTGDIVVLYGYHFEVSDVKEYFENGRRIIRFTGHCTPSDRNDSIRNTVYDGGVYGAWSDEMIYLRP